MGGVVVDELSAGVHSDLIDQFPTHPEGLGGGGHAHPVDGQSLEDPAGHPVGELGPVIGAVEGGLEDFPRTLLIGAGESGDTNVQAGGKPHDRQVNQSADSVITQFPGLGAVGAVPLDSDRGGVDDGEGSGVGGSGDRQADFCRAADGVCDEVATRLHSRVLVRSDGSVVTLILYRPGPLHVVPPRTGLCGQLRTPKREEPHLLTFPNRFTSIQCSFSWDTHFTKRLLMKVSLSSSFRIKNFDARAMLRSRTRRD